MKNKLSTKECKKYYPYIHKLGLDVYTLPVGHIKSAELDKVLTKKQIKQFSDFFGCQTCPVVDGKGELYPWDTEAVLIRMFSGRLTGTQLHWD